MKKARLNRDIENTEQGLFGHFILPSGKELFSGELEWNANEVDHSSFPDSIVYFRLTLSPSRSKKNREKHKAEIDTQPVDKREEFAKQFDVWVYQMYDPTDDGIDDCSGREAVQLHVGNYCGDIRKGYKSDVKGCIILGTGFYNGSNGGQKMITGSVDAIKILEEEMNGEPFELNVSPRS